MRSLARVGLQVQPGDKGGVVVTDVVPGSGAAAKGVRAGDVILTVNGEEVSSAEEVLGVLRDAEGRGRQAALFQIRRGDASNFVAIPFAKG